MCRVLKQFFKVCQSFAREPMAALRVNLELTCTLIQRNNFAFLYLSQKYEYKTNITNFQCIKYVISLSLPL